jgi:UPF0755 protein
MSRHFSRFPPTAPQPAQHSSVPEQAGTPPEYPDHAFGDGYAHEWHDGTGDGHDEPVEQFFEPELVRTRRSMRPSKIKQRRRRRSAIIMLLVVALFAGTVFGITMFLRDLLGMNEVKDYAGPGDGSVVFEVPAGAGPLMIGTALEEQDIVATSNAFLGAFQEVSDGREIQPGEYEMRYRMTAEDAARTLLEDVGARVHYVPVARGLRQGEVFDILAEKTGIERAEFQELAKDPASFGLPDNAPSLEGYLFPGEYRFDVEASARDMVQAMVDGTFKQLEKDGVSDPAEQYRVLTIASIVEAEGGEADYAKVAGAIMNRLKPGNSETNGLIQSDATVTYGLDRKSYNITPEEKADKSNPYNTYAIPGLPAGPIGSPGAEAIDAAVNPADVPFYYWVTVNLDTGETKFSQTLAEHGRYVEEYQQWCADQEPGRCE